MALALAPSGPVVERPWEHALVDRERAFGRYYYCTVLFGGFFGLFELAVAV